MREDTIKEFMTQFLSRLNAPRAVAQKPEAMKQEAKFLYKKVCAMAPTKNLTDWLEQFQDQVLSNLETRSWPTVKDLQKAAKEIAPKRPEFTDLTGDNVWKPDPLVINAKRIKARESVDEKYIQGKLADKLVSLGLIQEEDLHDYREAMAIARHKVYGQ